MYVWARVLPMKKAIVFLILALLYWSFLPKGRTLASQHLETSRKCWTEPFTFHPFCLKFTYIQVIMKFALVVREWKVLMNTFSNQNLQWNQIQTDSTLYALKSLKTKFKQNREISLPRQQILYIIMLDLTHLHPRYRMCSLQGSLFSSDLGDNWE